MKQIMILTTIVLVLAVGLAFAFVYQVPILNKEAILQLPDEQLMDNYIEVLVEFEASTTFHQTSGFKPSDYEKHKNLIRYRLLLEKEIQHRGLDAPQGTAVEEVEVPTEEPVDPAASVIIR